MLKKVLVIASLSALCGSVFAQSEQKNPYVEKMQQEFQSASAQAQAQFEKNYPAPHVNPMQGGKATPPAEAPSVQTVPVPTPPKPQSYTFPKQESATQEPAKKIPDIAVNSDNSSSSPNIYAPGSGNSQNNSSTYNPYR